MKITKQEIAVPMFRAVRDGATGILLCFVVMLFMAAAGFAQAEFERRPISSINIVFADNETDPAASAFFGKIAKDALGEKFSSVKVRNALQALYETGRIESVAVEGAEDSQGVAVSFILKRKEIIRKVNVSIGRASGRPITPDEVLFRLNLLSPGSLVTEQSIRGATDAILAFLFERGYFNASVTFEKKSVTNKTQIELTFKVEPGDQARMKSLGVEIAGYDSVKLRRSLRLQPGTLYSRDGLGRDFERIKAALRSRKFLAARFEEPNPIFDRDTNTVEVSFKGVAGPPVEIRVEAVGRRIDGKGFIGLLPIMREGTLEYSAIVEGERKLEEKFQERGYFFADVKAYCAAYPAFTETEASYTANDTTLLCSALSGAELGLRKVTVRYSVELGKQLRLEEIRIKGLEEFIVDDEEICRIGDGSDNFGRPLPLDEIRALLGSTKASLIGIVPYLGYGRGFTSSRLLADDEETIRSLLNELGYRSAKVNSRQGVSLDGENLIITFDVDAGPRTRITTVEIRGNTTVSTDTLAAELKKDFPQLETGGYSRALVRNAARKLSEYYSKEGFYEARVNYSIENTSKTGSDDVKVIFTVEDEGKKVLINRVLLTGNEGVRRETIFNTLNFRPGQALRSPDIFSSEQILYASDVFRRVEIKPQVTGDDGKGQRLADIEVNVEEQPPRTVTYGGGFSTDAGPFGSFDIRHYNLFGRLQQGGVRVRTSRLRQLVQFDYVNPRFLRDGSGPDSTPRFAPLTVTAQFQRDTTITRFFRSAFDKGTFGIVQRIDANGVPVDELGRDAGSPTINRVSLSAETSRTLSVRNRTIVFARYRYEDVRLSNIDSLLIKNLLSPDARIRISGFGANIVRDTRENCRLKYSLVDIASKGGAVARCRYNPSDATRGDYLTAEYTASLTALGANTGFHKFQATYNAYFSPRALKNTTLAARGILGVARVFRRGSSFRSSGYPALDDVLPISERFFAGGAQSIRGFDFESAGPRVVIVPQGTFRKTNGQIVSINPFTVPYGGNALAMVNLEARMPVSESVRVVPFYDGGNVFRTASEIFKRPGASPSDAFKSNLKAEWTNTLGLGLRLKTPVGGELAVDYGYLLNPPKFLVPQHIGPNAIYRLHQGQLHFRFAQAF